MKQIILITDGNSNVGMSPVSAAAQAYARGIVVNVIGIVDSEAALGLAGGREIEEIARAGGGMHRFVTPSKLAYTMQMMTRQTVMATIQQVVNKELKEIFRDEEASIEKLSPVKRALVVQTVDQWTESAAIQVALLIDASASMKDKFGAVREAAADLLLSMQARSGKSEIAVLHYPGNSSKLVEMDTFWTTELAKMEKILYKLNVKGTTPTGPAIMETLEMIGGERKASANDNGSALWDDYVV